MKKDRIYKLCKNSKNLVLMNRFTDELEVYEQWISDGYAAYLHENMPVFDNKTAPALLNIPKEKEDSIHIEEQDITSRTLFTDNRIDSDIPMKKLNYTFEKYVTFVTDNSCNGNYQNRTVFVDNTFLRPLEDEDDGGLNWYLRCAGGETAIVAFDGFLLRAVINPVVFEDSTSSRKRLEWLEIVVKELRMEVEG